MAFIPITLTTGFSLLGTPATMPGDGQIASSYTNVIDSYASLVTPPSTTSAPARAALLGVLQGVTVQAMNLELLLATGLSTYAGILATGMLPAFTGTPPPVPIVLSAIAPLGQQGASASSQASILATTIDLWFRTGIAVNNVSGASIPWS